MKLNLQISPELEVRLRAMAERDGQSLEAVATALLAGQLAEFEVPATKLPLAEWLAKLRSAANSRTPGDPRAEFDRDRVYDGCGE